MTSRGWRAGVVVALVVLGVVGAAGQGAAEALAPKDGPAWIPPRTGEWDWLHLKSGEWLKGDFKALRERKVTFDSDKLNELVIKLSDIKTIYLYQLAFIRFESGVTAQGRGVLRGELLTFEDVDGRTIEAKRVDIVSIVPGGERELDYWSAEASLAYALKDGNTDQVDLSGMLGIYRNTATLRFHNEYRGVYGSQDREKTTNNHRATSQVDVFLTSRLFVIIPSIDYYRDEFKNLKHRVSPGAGVGYEFIRNGWVELDVSVGGVYQFTEFEDGRTSNDFAPTLGVSLDLDLPRGVELDNRYALQYVATDASQTSHHAQSVFSVDVFGPVEVELTFMLDRIEEPERDGDGSRPDSNDVTLMAGFSVEF